MNFKLYKYFILLTFTALMPLTADVDSRGDITHEIPVIDAPEIDGYEKVPDVAQYKNADWSNVIGIAKRVSLKRALEIANENADITFFFYMKGYQMVLEREDGTYRVFSRGDAVFFSGEPWWGSAPGFSDGYIKKTK